MSDIQPEKIPKFTEWESKYRTELSNLFRFKQIAEKLGEHTFLYVQGPDEYFIREGSPFLRLRISQYPVDGKHHFVQLTSKEKRDPLARNNIVRQEVNLGLSGNSPDEIRACIAMLGYRRDFAITKWCHIYNFNDAVLVFYGARREDQSSEDHFIEIEVREETISELTEDEAWAILEKYEKALEPLGIGARNRVKKSLFDIYHREG